MRRLKPWHRHRIPSNVCILRRNKHLLLEHYSLHGWSMYRMAQYMSKRILHDFRTDSKSEFKFVVEGKDSGLPHFTYHISIQQIWFENERNNLSYWGLKTRERLWCNKQCGYVDSKYAARLLTGGKVFELLNAYLLYAFEIKFINQFWKLQNRRG